MWHDVIWQQLCRYPCFRRTYLLHLQDGSVSYPENRSSRFFGNISNCLHAITSQDTQQATIISNSTSLTVMLTIICDCITFCQILAIISFKCRHLQMSKHFQSIFIVAQCILITLKFLSPTNAPLYYTYKMLKYTVKISHDCSYMFRSTRTVIREPMPNLAKVTILWKIH